MRLHPNPPTKVIKDFWLDRDAESEEAIQTKIFNMFNKVNDIGDVSDAKDYFMNIVCDEIVRQDGEEDVVKDLDCYRMYYLEDPKVVPKAESLLRETGKAITGHSAPLPKPALPRLRLYRGKVHRRILFDEVGAALDDVRDHDKYFGALIDAAKGGSPLPWPYSLLTLSLGLRFLYSAGYVHRDISTGNVLLCNGRGKISDLEYARPFEVLVSTDNGATTSTSLHKPQEKEFKTVNYFPPSI